MNRDELIGLLSTTSGYAGKHPSEANEILNLLAAHGLTVAEVAKVQTEHRLVAANTEAKATEIPNNDNGLMVNVGSDGTWLHFTTSTRKHYAVNMENEAERKGLIFGSAIEDWCLDRRKQAEKIKAKMGIP